jgi:antitoxin ParD1/3/4
MTGQTIVLTQEQQTFVANMVESGFYSDANDVIREALSKLEQENQAKLIALRQALDEGEASGIFEGDAFASVRREMGWETEV